MAKKKDKKELKAYGYVRVSTSEQAEEGISIEVQKGKIRAYATLHDLKLMEIIKDEGYSGKNIDRPGIQRLIGLVEGKEAETIIVYKLDRLSRKTWDVLYLVEKIFKQGNTRFFSITEQIDTKTAMGKFLLTIMGAMAQMERELIAERTMAALAYKKEKGERLGAVPYGFRLEDKNLVKDPKEQKILRKIKRLRKKGKSYREIAKILNDKGVLAKRGKPWHHGSIWFILKKTIRKKKLSNSK